VRDMAGNQYGNYGATGSGYPVCLLCGRKLNDPNSPVLSKDFGGDCAACMADVGDPDAIKWIDKQRSKI